MFISLSYRFYRSNKEIMKAELNPSNKKDQKRRNNIGDSIHVILDCNKLDLNT